MCFFLSIKELFSLCSSPDLLCVISSFCQLTPLHKAVISDNKDVVVYLAGRGAKINTKDYLHVRRRLEGAGLM